ncbi:MAG: hypothetical protein JWL65_2844 [Gammaproteobacteria bacterium]|nr:hypothetical protein [Gammaproteobacteria bacterium]
MRVEILKKDTDEVVETRDVDDYRTWRYHWRAQCESKTHWWRALVREIHHPVCLQSQQPERVVPLTNELVNRIATFNGSSTASVSTALLMGRSVYTNFNEYRLA